MDLSNLNLPEDVLEAIKAKLSKEELEALGNAQIARTSPITVKVSEKGAFSVYGLGRFPVTLHKGQWERLFTVVDKLKAYIKDNENHPAVVEAAKRHSDAKAEKRTVTQAPTGDVESTRVVSKG